MHNETNFKTCKTLLKRLETHNELKVKCHFHFTFYFVSSKVHCLSICFRHLSEIIKGPLFTRERTMNGNDNLEPSDGFSCPALSTKHFCITSLPRKPNLCLFDFNRKMIKLSCCRSEVSNRVSMDNEYEAQEFLPCMLLALTAYDKTHLL